ncbi:hypothetical protein V1506DRAFT_531151 [Lipomyces tetrasporus]
MAGNYVVAYGSDRAGPGPTAAMYIPQQHIPAGPLQYQHQQHAMATMPPPAPQSMQVQVQVPDQHQQQHQPQQPQQSQHHEQRQQQLFRLEKQQYLEQQYAHDPLTAAFFAADPSVAPGMISNVGTLNNNDYNHDDNANNRNNEVILDLLANDLASSISANPTADFVLCPPSPNHPPPDFSRVQRISEQYMRTGDAPYIASAALFQGGWDGLEGWKQSPPSQASQQSSMLRPSLLPASQAYIQPGAPLNPRQVPLTASSSASVPTGTQQPGPVPVSQQNGYWKPPPPQQEPIQRPVQSQFQQSPAMLQQQLDRLRSLPQQPMQRHPSPSQQLPQPRNVPDDSFEFSKINWADLQSNILNAPPGGASQVQASGLVLGTGHPPINQFTPVCTSESPVMPQSWGTSPVPSTHSMDYAMSAHSSPSTPGGVFHPHRRAVSFPVYANIPANAQNKTSPFLADRSKTQLGPWRTNEPTSSASHVLYTMQQPFGGPHVRGEVEARTPQSVATIAHTQPDVQEGDVDILEFEGRLNVLPQSTDQGQSSAAPIPRPDMTSTAGAGPSAAPNAFASKLGTEKTSMKRKDTRPVVSGAGPKKTKEQIQADKAAAKEEKARAKAEKQKLQREKAAQKKRDQAMRRAHEEQAMKKIREKLALEEQENECTSGASGQVRAEESDKRRKIDSSSGDKHSQKGAARTAVAAGEVSLYPDTQAEFLFAQRELLTDAFVPRVPPVNTQQVGLPAIDANGRNVPTGPSVGDFATQPTQTQTSASASPFVYHVKPAPNTPSTASGAALDKSNPAFNLARGPSPQSSLSNTGQTRAEGHEEDMIVQKTPAPTQAKIVQSTAKMEKSLQKPSVVRPSLKKQASKKSKVQSISPKPPQSHAQSFSGASQPMAQPSSEFKFSSPPEATSTPANYRTNNTNMPNPVIFAGQMDTQSHLFSQRSPPATDPVKSPTNGPPQTKRPFMRLNNVDSVSEDTEKDNNDFVNKMGMDLEEIFGSDVGVGVGLGGASEAAETTFQDAQQPLAMESSPYGIGNGMTADEDRVLGDVLGKVEEWSKSLQWNIGEEAMRLGGISSNSSGSES